MLIELGQETPGRAAPLGGSLLITVPGGAGVVRDVSLAATPAGEQPTLWQPRIR